MNEFLWAVVRNAPEADKRELLARLVQWQAGELRVATLLVEWESEREPDARWLVQVGGVLGGGQAAGPSLQEAIEGATYAREMAVDHA